MAKVKTNALIEGLSGGVGKLVFKQYGDNTVVCKWPDYDPNRPPTPGEARHRERIKKAAVLAKSILATEAGQAYYQAARERLGKHSAYHAAVFDYFGEPEIVAVSQDADKNLIIQILDNVGVREVRIEFSGEVGYAELIDDGPNSLWRFSLKGNLPQQVQISAEDWMGNIGEWGGTLDT